MGKMISNSIWQWKFSSSTFKLSSEHLRLRNDTFDTSCALFAYRVARKSREKNASFPINFSHAEKKTHRIYFISLCAQLKFWAVGRKEESSCKTLKTFQLVLDFFGPLRSGGQVQSLVRSQHIKWN